MSNLKKMRESKKLSQKELSEKSGVNIRMIQYYEQGVKDINKAQGITIVKLANALECNERDLIDVEIKEVKNNRQIEAMNRLYSFLDLIESNVISDVLNDILAEATTRSGRYVLWYMSSDINSAIYVDTFEILTEEEIEDQLC